ncbi:MAG: ABC transporter substrate-binding protein, partial [Betaproteobacteria bacterium]
MRFVKLPLLLACTTALIAIAQAQVPAGYPADYAKILDGAKKEGKV